MDQILFQLTQTCQIHTKKKIKYLQVKDLENRVSQNIFLCDECFNDDLECKSKDILKISQIVEDGEKQIITKWPPLEDQEIAKKLNLQNLLIKCQQKQQMLNFEFPNQIKEQIIYYIDEIKFFNEQYINLNLDTLDLSNIKSTISSDKLMQLISNKSNFCSDSFLKQVRDILDMMNPILDKIQFENIQLQDSDTEDLVALLKKRALFQDKNIYERSQSYQQKQALISQKYYKKQEVEQIFRKFPIYDLLQQNMIDILEKIQIMGTQYNESFQRLLIKKNSNRLIEIKVDESNYFGNFKGYDINCVSQNILEKQKKYIFRIKCDINQPIVQFDIGLIQNDNVDKIQGYNDNLSCKFQSLQNKIKYFGGHGIDNITKGKYFCVDNNSIFELRVWIGGKKLEILDYPNYQNKIELVDENKKYLDSYKDLRVYLYLFDQSINYQITEAFIVEQFDI
ncbi:hypothetical protein ABPG73_000754 [Tetrahymena malaccensis]